MREALPLLRDVMKRYDITPKRVLGQNFLLDANLTDKIARVGGELSAFNVIEIGPGPGGLTRSLLNANARAVYAVEKDARCVAALEELAAASDRLHIIEADALEIDLMQTVPAPRIIAANLPYNIATVLLVQWLEQIYAAPHAFARLTLMFQKEVAERIAAAPNSKAYGRLSVLAQWLCESQMEFDIPPDAFVPPPKVTSTVITLTPRAQPLAPAELKPLQQVLAAAFGQRRKMLRVALKTLQVDAEQLLQAAGIDATRRGETLDIHEFCRLAQCYARMKNTRE